MSKTPTIYSIDFGTSNSLLGASDAKQIYELAKIDSTNADATLLRSVMYFPSKDQTLFGLDAIKNYFEEPGTGRFLRSFKRFLPQKSFEGTVINNRFWSIEEIIARFLRELRERADQHYKTNVTRAVIGRPAAFSDDPEAEKLAQERLYKAAKLSGFAEIEFLPEPVAAAYRFQKELKNEELVLVADFGGGTSDFTVLKMSQKEFDPKDVLAVGGVPLAGDALDGAIMKMRIAKHFGSEVSYQVPLGKNVLTMPKAMSAHLYSTAYINLLNSPENREFLRRVEDWALGKEDERVMTQLEILLENNLGFSVFESIEKSKRDLGQNTRTAIEFNYPGIEIEENYTRKGFERDASPEISKIFEGLDDTLARAGVSAQKIDRVCCTGGSARAVLIQEEMKKRFSHEKLEAFRHFTSIVEGLAVRARQIAGQS